MPNPFFSGFDNKPNQQSQAAPNNQSNDLFELFQTVKNSPNPNLAMQNILASNPNFQNVVQYINKNGGNARSAFYNLAAQKGTDPNSILNRLR